MLHHHYLRKPGVHEQAVREASLKNLAKWTLKARRILKVIMCFHDIDLSITHFKSLSGHSAFSSPLLVCEQLTPLQPGSDPRVMWQVVLGTRGLQPADLGQHVKLLPGTYRRTKKEFHKSSENFLCCLFKMKIKTPATSHCKISVLQQRKTYLPSFFKVYEPNLLKKTSYSISYSMQIHTPFIKFSR